MELLVSAVAFLIIFSVIILIHEFGHFYVAKKSGIKVEEFGIGLPPRIWGKKYKGTIYSVNWIPFGGFNKLMGEDSTNPAVLKSKQSFAGKPLRIRMAVVCAGVFMNFLLAFILLTIGFSIGIEPLIVNGEDVYNAINNKTIEISHDIRVKSVQKDSAAEKAGILKDDVIIKINGEDIKETAQLDVLTSDAPREELFIDLKRGDNRFYVLLPEISQTTSDRQGMGLTLYDPIYLPRVFVKDVKADSESALADIRPGDIIVEINEIPAYTVTDYLNLIIKENVINYKLLRNNEIIAAKVEFSDKNRVIVMNVEADMPAAEAGFIHGDLILSINDKEILTPDEAIAVTKQNIGKSLLYKIDRNGEILDLTVTPEQSGRIGVGLITVLSYKNSQLSVYNAESLASVIKVNEVKYPIHLAFKQALNESGRLAVLTVDMFGNLVKSVFSRLAVPEGVAGPVGIARLTHVFAQQGLLALLRFTALLSLSLAVINILPLPALDGGRLLFLLVEAVRGKRVPAKWETAIHTFGFLLLIGLIFIITYSDILNIFL
ncbi:RIP metalloprotease RseP [Candidatus Peregrinibacteria bacterium]|nr:RIP metalloprotease RseP [Candidatus Peregrinibacteria bacterium]